MKRSHSIRLFLIGGIAAGELSGCKQKPSVSAENVYTNNFHLPGVGYYHAPFRDWFYLPYNHFDPQTQRYYYGGHWEKEPMQNFTNISSPTRQAAEFAETSRTDISRGGFGGTGGGYYMGGG